MHVPQNFSLYEYKFGNGTESQKTRSLNVDEIDGMISDNPISGYKISTCIYLTKAALRRAFYVCIYCMQLRFQRNYVGWFKPR